MVDVSDANVVHQPLASLIGVASCDAYLARYSACHRVAAVYPVADIDARHRDLRESLMRDRAAGADSAALESRCANLAELMALKLGNRVCNSNPVVARQAGTANR